MTRERGACAESKNREILLFPTTEVLTRKSNAPPGGPHFRSNAQGLPDGGGMGGFGIDWYIRRHSKKECGVSARYKTTSVGVEVEWQLCL